MPKIRNNGLDKSEFYFGVIFENRRLFANESVFIILGFFPMDRIWGNFDPLGPMLTLLLNSVKLVLWFTYRTYLQNHLTQTMGLIIYNRYFELRILRKNTGFL